MTICEAIWFPENDPIFNSSERIVYYQQCVFLRSPLTYVEPRQRSTTIVRWYELSARVWYDVRLYGIPKHGIFTSRFWSVAMVDDIKGRTTYVI